jgi:hypothetical protein
VCFCEWTPCTLWARVAVFVATLAHAGMHMACEV